MTPCCLLNVSRSERKVIFMRSLLLQAVEQHMGYLCLQRALAGPGVKAPGAFCL